MAFEVVEICAGAGGQALGLERAGFAHALAVELDKYPVQTLRENRSQWKVAHGDVADPDVWRPRDYAGVDLFAGGVPCPPFSIAGKQLGANDERDLFAWAVEQVVEMKPRAVLLENVRGLSMPRFAAYRQAVLDRLADSGYVGDWKLLQASDYGVPQLRPRFVLVALRETDAPFFQWPAPVAAEDRRTVGQTLLKLMYAGKWRRAAAWAKAVDKVSPIAPTIVGGSKKHGGADLGPTRAKQAWRAMHVDAMGLANAAPDRDWGDFRVRPPKLTVEMVSRLQGWDPEWEWNFAGGKTAQYRQVGNAFPPPLAQAVGESIRKALDHESEESGARTLVQRSVHDDVYRTLREADGFVTLDQLAERLASKYSVAELHERVTGLERDFEIIRRRKRSGEAVMLGHFKAFIGQEDHHRHAAFAEAAARSRIS
ncbi:DNA cytosine methyltransferase [Cellulomonas sp. Root137]|uniref:DNA cytosine methyltransferase n=1 Tax=Cellulomonas sp. Root137 TaxID=1736459 RepID=UPI001F265621|nr:DNA (cytosine-5-)-methyltransferase [Cellulomonas sp. Root137]